MPTKENNLALERLRRSMSRRNLDAILVSQPENRRYVSGFSAVDSSIAESSGVLLIPRRGQPFLLTDSRFELHARAEAAGFEVLLYPKGLLALLGKILPDLQIRHLGFESEYSLHAVVKRMEELLAPVELVPLVGLVEKMRDQKEEEELGAIERSVQLNEQVFAEVYQDLAPGQTEVEVALKIESAMRMAGAERPSFDTIVAAGPNGAMPHAVPSSRPIREGEPVVIDMGLVLDGYCSDMTRTVVLGRVDSRTRERFRLVRRSQLAGLAMVRAGVKARDVDLAARQVLEEGGLADYFTHGLGHGVGLAVHEAPSLNRRSRRKLKTGQVVTVEPGIYIPHWGGIRLENMVVVGKDGCRELNRDTTFLDL